MAETMREIVLASRPVGAPKDADFRLEEKPLPEPGPGEALIKTRYLSLDPYMRGRLSAAKSYAASVEIGEAVTGETVGEVIASNAEGFAPGDLVAAMGGWRSHSRHRGDEMRKLDPSVGPLSHHLGVLGMPGLTAYVGLLDIGAPKPGETVVVAAATGAVGSVVGQIARIKGARVVGVAGGAEKCAYAVEALGFDACLDHRAADFEAELAAACPDGIDVYFESVSGRVFWAVLELLNDHARVPVCGLIANYNLTDAPEGGDRSVALMRNILVKRLKFQGFIIFDHYHRAKQAFADIGGWLAAGDLTYREDVVEGLENAPAAFQGLLEGRNFGKLVVKV